MRTKWSILLAVVLTASMLLSACSKPDSPASTDAPRGDDNAPAAVAEMRINLHSEPPALHPGLASDNVSGGVLNQTFEGLTRIGRDGSPEPAAAEKIDISEDQKTYTFTLRDALWSNGDPVTAHDFEYAWKWVLDPNNEAKYAYQLYYIQGAEEANSSGSMDNVRIKALNDKTLEVELVNPTPYFLELTSFYTYFPINSKIAAGQPKWAENAGDAYTSNGPFVLTEWQHSSKLLLKKNDNYWDKNTVKLDQIVMTIVNDESTALAMYESNELDWAGKPIDSLPTDTLSSLREAGVLNAQASAGTYFYNLNINEPPLDNTNLRKALAYAIDRRSLIDNVSQGGELPAMAFVPPTIFEDNTAGYFADNAVDQAKQYLELALKELGYASAAELPTLTLSYNTSEGHQKIAQAIQDMWINNLGIDVTLDNSEWKVYIEKLQTRDYQIGRLGWVADFNDAVNFLETLRDHDGGNNNTGWENAEYKKLLQQSAMESDAAKRRQLLKSAEEILMDEMPIIPIYFYSNTWLQKDYVKDVFIDGLSNIHFKWAYIDK